MKRAAAVVALVAVVALGGPVARGQQPAAQSPPRVGYVYPAGGQQGTTVRVTVGGQFLDGVSDVLVSGRDVGALVVSHDKPLNQRQLNELRERVQALQPKAASDAAVRQELLTLRAQVADTVRRNRNPGLSELVTLDVTLAADAQAGARQLRLRTPFGLSTPLTFDVGQLPEARENDEETGPAGEELIVTLPATVNGRIIPRDQDNPRQPIRQAAAYLPGDVDRVRFAARRDQELVIVATARDLTPYLADAVPGWFQAVVTLYDSAGREVGFCDDYRFRPDPVLHYRVPADGDYLLEIKDAIYRGREDFVYRVSIGELPFITHIFPLGGRVGERTSLDVHGWNLPVSRVTVNATDAPAVHAIALSLGGLASNRVPFAIDEWPDELEREPNDRRDDAHRVQLAKWINGRVDQPGDSDVFSFSGRAGDAIVAEVVARRLESPLDSVLELTDRSGARIAFNDDYEDKAAGRLTHHADSLVRATLPADGVYFVRIGDVQRHGGPEFAYRLRLGPPRPDFELRITPSAINATHGANVPVTITALRKDGFAGDIALALKDAPDGVVMSGGLVPAGQDHVRVTLTAPALTTRGAVPVRLEGRATILGRPVVREARPADDRTQAFAYHHLVAADDLRMSVSGRGGTRVPVRVEGAWPARIPAGGSVRLRVTLPPAYQMFENIQFELSEPPEGITLGRTDVSSRATNATILIQADAKTAAGLRGNLIVLLSGERVPGANAEAQATRRRVPLGALPAIPFEVVAPKRGNPR